MIASREAQSRVGVRRLRSNWPAAMLFVLLLAFGLRMYGITFGAPFEGYYWWDERSAIAKSWSILRDPGPSSIQRGLYPLMLSAVHYPLSVLQNHTWNPRAVIALSLNSQLLIARALSAMAGTALVGFVYLLGRRLSGHLAGLSAATLTAISPALVAESRYATTGMSVTLLIYLAMLMLTSRRISFWKRLSLCLAASTLAVLTKSNGIAAFALCPLALLVETAVACSHQSRRMFPVKRIALIAGLGFAGLLVAAWLVKPDVVLEYWYQATGYARINRAGASPGAAWRWMFRFEWWTLLGGIAGAILGIVRRVRLPNLLLIVIFVALYGTVVSLFSTVFVRWLMVILPGLAILAGPVAAHGLESRRSMLRVLTAGLLLAVVALGTMQAVKQGHNLLHDVRIAAWEWAQEELPPGAKIAMEPHSLPSGAPVSTRYRIQMIRRAIDQPPTYYVENGFHFLLVADDMYDRWQANPAAHAKQMEEYETLFEAYEEVARFRGTLLHAPPAIEIRVLQISDTPVYPADRLTLGAGWYGEENATGTPRRWMTEKGQLFYNHSGQGGERKVLSFDAYVFRDMSEITAYVNNQPGVQLSVDGTRTLRHIEIPLELVEGLNRIELVSERGCGRPIVYDPESKDTRCISIKVGNMKLEAAP